MVIGYLSECISRKGRERGFFSRQNEVKGIGRGPFIVELLKCWLLARPSSSLWRGREGRQELGG